MSQTFDWIQFPEGRARFAGGVRGWDELGHETFALELRGNEYFGEIKRSYLDNHNDYNIVIDAFGYVWEIEVGMPEAEAREVFTPEEEATARTLVVQLIQAGLKFDRPPSRLNQTETSHFMGKIIFQDGWILVRSDSAGAVQ
ncbi:hypothetical protein [Luteimonas panaciterrae]|uniref:hypothetical protein n=1 Tax=Luteimonas panaciterrae TaxID=363885 RepID=UPI001CF9351E|nr:hypothetical protein [Luteimonas panaciterrae]